MSKPFWETKKLDQMTSVEFESLCDGCGRCCLVKLDVEEEIFYTSIACKLFDDASCRCKQYEIRKSVVPDCTKLDPQNLETFKYLPSTCAYGLLNRGHALPSWHPLISKDPNSVHAAGISVQNKTVSEDEVPFEDQPNYIIGSDAPEDKS
jgi:uncharacterized cysteine cluster protein YcgN (CxxCxxCC family)